MLKRDSFRVVAAQFVVLASIASTFLALPAPSKSQAAQIPTNQSEIKVFVSIMDPKIVSDTFGKRVAQRFVAIQVTIANHNKDYQYLINDVSLDLAKVFPNIAKARGNALPSVYTQSSAELSMLRGVAEKGQGQDTRNKTLRFFRAVGTIAAGLIGVTSFGPSYPKSVAIFNGPVISAFSEAFPDYTINQMNRLSDSAYQANTLIPQKHSKVIVAFIPLGDFLSKEQQRRYFDDPTSLYAENGKCQATGCVDFRLAEATLDGDFITQISNLPPTVSTAVFDSSEVQKFQDAKPIVKGYISGQFLTGSTIDLLNQDLKGLSVALDGTPASDRINFIVQSDKPVAPGTRLEFEVSNPQGVQRYSKDIRYMPDPPTLTAITPGSGKQNSTMTVTLIGTNFIPGAGNTRVNVSGSDIEVSEPVEVVGTSLKVTLRIGGNASLGPHNVTVVNANTASSPLAFTITATTAALNP
jgi:Quinohemoprotein amine dehydrogenase, alpha subunit domain III